MRAYKKVSGPTASRVKAAHAQHSAWQAPPGRRCCQYGAATALATISPARQFQGQWLNTRQARSNVLIEALNSPGVPLEPAVREPLEQKFGHDFSNIRVHDHPRASDSAESISANAYTIGNHVVFARNRFQPQTPSGRRLLAHELTHSIQQSAGASVRSAAVDEAEAEHVAQSVTQGNTHTLNIGASAPALRADGPRRSDTEHQADMADVQCDLRRLCRLRAEAPDIVSVERIRGVAERCNVLTAFTLNPCLDPAMLTPTSPPRAAVTPAPAPTRTGAAPSALGGLSGLTEFGFSLGDVAMRVEIPSSLRAQLPVELRGAARITFSLTATTSGVFTFAITLDGIPHIRIRASTSVDVGEQRGTSSLTIQSTRTVCRAQDPEAARRALQSKGQQLRDAILAVQNPPAPEEGQDEAVENLRRIADVVSKISDVYDAIETARAPCRQVPLVEFGVTGRYPVGEESEETGSVTAGLTFRF